MNRKFSAYFIFFLFSGVALAAAVFAWQAVPGAVGFDALSSCIGAGASHAPDRSCLERVVRTLIKEEGVPALLMYSTSSTSPEDVVRNCHAIGHVIGKEAYDESHSLPETMNVCLPLCGYGCIHGALSAAVAEELGAGYSEEAFAHADADAMGTLGQRYCGSSGTLCHGVGHLLYIVEKEYDTALRWCDRVASGAAARNCYDGVFMEGSGSTNALFPHSLDGGEKRSFGYPCDSLETRYLDACYMYLPLFQMAELARQGTSSAGWVDIGIQGCARLKGDERGACFFGLGYRLDFQTAEVGSEDFSGAERCQTFADTDAKKCIEGLVSQHVLFDRHTHATSMCAALEGSFRPLCYEEFFRVNDRAHPERNRGASPCQGPKKDECINAYQEYRRSLSR